MESVHSRQSSSVFPDPMQPAEETEEGGASDGHRNINREEGTRPFTTIVKNENFACDKRKIGDFLVKAAVAALSPFSSGLFAVIDCIKLGYDFSQLALKAASEAENKKVSTMLKILAYSLAPLGGVLIGLLVGIAHGMESALRTAELADVESAKKLAHQFSNKSFLPLLGKKFDQLDKRSVMWNGVSGFIDDKLQNR